MSVLPSTLTSSNKWDESRTKPSLKLVMGTLFAVTLPIEIGFLAVLRGVGWLEIPFLFIGFYILFFCVTVRLFYLVPLPVDRLIPVRARFARQTFTGWNLTHRRQVPHEFPLVQRIRPRYVRHAGAFGNDGLHWSIGPCGLFRARKCNRRKGSDADKPPAHPPSPLGAPKKTRMFPTKCPCRHRHRYQDRRRNGRPPAFSRVWTIEVHLQCIQLYPSTSRHSHFASYI